VSDGELTGGASAALAVANVAPSVTADDDVRGTAKSPVTLTASFADAGSRDGDWSYTIDWGNGDVTRGVVREQDAAAIAESYSYATAGTFFATVTVTDKDGAEGRGYAMITVAKAQATVVLDDLSQVYDGAPKYASASTMPAGLNAVIVYSTLGGGAVAAPTAAGRYMVAATIIDPAYAGSATGTLVIAKASPVISWNAADLLYGQALGAAQLNATAAGANGAPLAGRFTYSPAAGMVPDAGPQTLRVQFAPADSANYTSAGATTEISVLYTAAAGRRFLAPLAQKGAVRIGSTIPVKFELFLADGVTPVTTASATISAVRISGLSSEELDELSTSMPPDEGQTFRVAAGGQYHFNLSTGGWTPGLYRITAWLDDGSRIVQDIEARSR
jgi:hypothetical protein